MALPASEPMRIDAVLRTYNRRDLLPGAVASFFAADQAGVEARLLVIDNNSSDGTGELLQALVAEHGPRLVPLHEPTPGGQHALNCGIAAATAPVIGFFDDDERIDANWLQAIRREFADPLTDYIAGPMRPAGGLTLPDWLPAGFGGVLGIIDSSPVRRAFGPGFAAMLIQGNCAVRRSIFAEVGPFPAELPTAEDRWLDQWLVAHGKRGFYCPDFAIDHMMQPERITPAYFRRWAHREGRDLWVCDRIAGRPAPFSHRWYWRHLAESARDWLLPGGAPARRLRGELSLRVAWAYVAAAWRGRG